MSSPIQFWGEGTYRHQPQWLAQKQCPAHFDPRSDPGGCPWSDAHDGWCPQYALSSVLLPSCWGGCPGNVLLILSNGAHHMMPNDQNKMGGTQKGPKRPRNLNDCGTHNCKRKAFSCWFLLWFVDWKDSKLQERSYLTKTILNMGIFKRQNKVSLNSEGPSVLWRIYEQ